MNSNNKQSPDDCSKFLHNIIDVDIHPHDILSAKKIGTKAKCLLLNFNSGYAKNTIFRNVKKARKKSFFASDFLTPRRSKLLYLLIDNFDDQLKNLNLRYVLEMEPLMLF
jgi:hypothetical protein